MRPRKLSEIAALLGGRLAADIDPVITGAASIEDAGPGDLTFVASLPNLEKLNRCRASGVIISPEMAADLPGIVVDKPFHAFARFLEELQVDLDRVFPVGVHATAVVHAEASVDPTGAVGPFSMVGPGTVVGPRTRIGSHVSIGPDVSLGADCLIYPQVTIREGTVIGDRVILHAGCSIGTDGFGYVPTSEGPHKVPQVGIVVLENDTEVGAGSCIDRATTGKTVIGAGTKIDNQVQIGHNVRVGKACAMSAQTGISGSCVLEDGVTLGGKVGIADHLRVGAGAKVAAMSGLFRDVPAGGSVFGYPALEFKESFRLVAALRKLPDLLRRVGKLERSVKGTDADKEI